MATKHAIVDPRAAASPGDRGRAGRVGVVEAVVGSTATATSRHGKADT